MKKETKNKGTKRNLPDVHWLSDEDLFKLRLKPEENFMPQEIRDYLRLVIKEIDRRYALKQEYKLKKRLKRQFNKAPKIMDNKQGVLSV